MSLIKCFNLQNLVVSNTTTTYLVESWNKYVYINQNLVYAYFSSFKCFLLHQSLSLLQVGFSLINLNCEAST